MLGRILVALGGLLVAALFAALLAPFFVDWTNFRSDFEDQASRILGKKVTVHGAVEARILPFPSVTLHDVTVGSDRDGSPLVSVARFSMDAELAPFLSGEARIFDMRIEEPKARIRLLSDGTLDWARGSAAEIPARTVVLERVHVSGGVVEFIDEQSGRTRIVSGFDADMSARSLAGPWTVDGHASVDGEAGRFHLSSLQPDTKTGAVPLNVRLLPDTRPFEIDLSGGLTLSDGKPLYKGNFQAAWQIAEGDAAAAEPQVGGANPVAPKVKGEFELTNERVRVPSYRLELGDAENPYAVTGEATLDTGAHPEFLLTADGQQIDVNRIGEGAQKGKTSRHVVVSVRERLDRLVAIAARIPIPSVPGKASLALPAIVAGDTVLRDIRLDVRPAGTGWTVERVLATLPGRTQVEASGTLDLKGEPSFRGDLLVASTQPSGLAAWITGDVDPAIREMKTAGFSAKVDLTPELQRFERLELAMGAGILNGRVERESRDGTAPNLSVDLTGNEIDLNAVRALATLVAGDEAGANLFAQRIAGRLKVERLAASDIVAKNVDAVFTADGERMAVERLNIGDLSGAKISATGTIEGGFSDPTGEADLAFAAADPGPFLAILKARVPAHPALDTLVRNARWYAGADLKAHVVLSGADAAMSVKLGGVANGSRVALDYGRETIPPLPGAMTLEASLENPDAQILFGQAGLDPLPIPSSEPGRLSVSLRAQADAPADTVVTFSGTETLLTAKGRLDLRAGRFLQGSLQTSLRSSDLEPYLMIAGIGLPQSGAGLPVALSAAAEIGDGTAKIDAIDGALAGNTVHGSLSLDWKEPGLRAGGALDLDTVDLAWLAEAVAGPVTDPATGGLSTGAIAAPIEVPDLDLSLRSSTFWPSVLGKVEDFSGHLTGRTGELVLEDAAGKWLGGDLKGRISLSNAEKTAFLQSRLTLENGDLATVFAGAGEGVTPPQITGRFDLTAVAEATGGTVAGLVSSINGSGEIRLSDVVVPHFDLGYLPPLLAAADLIEGEPDESKVRPLVENLVSERSASFGALIIPFNIGDGVVRAQNLVADNALARLGGDARIDLRSGATEAVVTVSPEVGTGDLAGADPDIRVRFSGRLPAPERSLDVTDVTNYLSLRAFERERRRVETLQSNVLEKQRLRREAALYKFRAAEREKVAAAERARLEEEARRQAEADALARKAAEEEAERRAAEEEAARQRAIEEGAGTAQPPAGAATSPAEEPPPAGPTTGGTPPKLRFEDLPGVN
ncbi:AsmA-like protein [Ciceribacter lividus]|uniref:AsmA-like protein n=1 Tax=Ciceribacter lividus TaxID=1197950 RepID=A0A6I7HRN5_9HYPH|nr:AsmA-like C-terminal region-containing protein [Ciceribacter lividus]RCW28406.1 AsmA-like protein [Ciceribacter lividus]